jgi:hypothetical protein
VINGNKPTVRLSPEIRKMPREPIPAIDWSAIEPFITNARVLLPGSFSDLPYVVANESQRMLGGQTDLTYVRGISGRPGDEFAIVRMRHIYYDDNGVMKRGIHHRYAVHMREKDEYPDNIWDATMSWRRMNPPVLGYEFWDIAVGRLIKEGDPAILEIQGGRTEVKPGDFILPIDDYVHDPQLVPHTMNPVPDGMEVIALTQTTYGSGHYQIVAINAGANQGVEVGHVFSVFRPGKTIQDEVKYPTGSWQDQTHIKADKVALPDRYSGLILIFRVFDEVSYAIIMDGERPVREHDLLRNPDERY